MKTVIQYEVYLPSSDANVLKPLRRDLVDFFGGLTDGRHPQEGIWRFGRAEIKDQILVWRILSDRGDEGDQFLRQIKIRLERELKQEQVLVIRRTVGVL